MKTRVAVIYGGRSGEHEVSLRSAKSIIDALDPEKYKVIHYLISPEGKWRPKPLTPEPKGNPEIDVVIPVLHGTFGEDGTIQGLLELADLPYVGAGVLGSAVSMDKEVMKRLAKERGLPVAEYELVYAGQLPDVDAMCARMPFPLFVKPANLGSSVGISKVRSCEELLAAITEASKFDRKVIVERGIDGREFECAVLGNEKPRASTPCEIIPSKDFYDYEDKYILNKAQTVIPADLTAQQTAEVQRLAVACYEALECEGLGRVDFLLENATGKFYLNELNTLPGFTSISMYPKMWEYSGLPMPELLDELIELAVARQVRKRNLRYAK